MTDVGIKASRFGIQGATAAAATYLACLWLGQQHLSWAIISALFVVQQSFNQTVSSAVGRLAGTVIGTFAGFGSVLVLGGGIDTVWRLIICAGLMCAIGGVWPSLRYGLVAATIIALETDPNVWGGALDRGAAILIGTTIGILAALTIWPQSAAKTALGHVRAALDDCRDLLSAEIDDLTGDEEKTLGPIHERFLRNIRSARSMANAATVKRDVNGVSLGQLIHALSRLWHGLIVVDRILTRDRREARMSPEIVQALGDVRDEACRYLARQANRKSPEAFGLEALDRCVVTTVELLRSAEPRQEMEPLAFALEEVHQNLGDIHKLLCQCE